MVDYRSICFVIMPFGTKNVGGKDVDFDRIYDGVFRPAIETVALPEGGKLEPRRTDKDFFSGDITHEMFGYLEYSRIALADISGLNANVFYEIGVRHRARESGTVIFRQSDKPIPFDINRIKAFPYEYEPEAQMLESRALVARVLAESLQMNRVDSPVQLTLKAQSADPPAVQKRLVEAENAIRARNLDGAVGALALAAAMVPGNAMIRLKLGILLRDKGAWDEALAHFQEASKSMPQNSDALRELGIAENKIYWREGRAPGIPSGEASLRRAVALQPNDYDAHASLGGILKREGRLSESLASYRTAREVSQGHSYPLMNEIKLGAHMAHRLVIDPGVRNLLRRLEPSLRAQVTNRQAPFNAPWSFFDLSEARLYQEDATEFLSVLREGLSFCTARWQPQTHRESLELLLAVEPAVAGLDEALGALAQREQQLPP